MQAKAPEIDEKPSKTGSAGKPDKHASNKPKLTYRDQRELGSLPAKIEKMEKLQLQLEEQLAAPGFYQSDHEEVRRVTRELARLLEKLEAAYQRWDELEALSQ